MAQKKISVADKTAATRLAGVLSPDAIDRLLDDAKASGLSIDGADGLLNQMTKAVLERALTVELTDHLGYEEGDPAGNGSGNSRNGHGEKTVATVAGLVRIAVPRDRNGTFEPAIAPKHRRRVGQIDELILSLYARGMTTRDIEAHLLEIYGISASPALVSSITRLHSHMPPIGRSANLSPAPRGFGSDGAEARIGTSMRMISVHGSQFAGMVELVLGRRYWRYSGKNNCYRSRSPSFNRVLGLACPACRRRSLVVLALADVDSRKRVRWRQPRIVRGRPEFPTSMMVNCMRGDHHGARSTDRPAAD